LVIADKRTLVDEEKRVMAKFKQQEVDEVKNGDRDTDTYETESYEQSRDRVWRMFHRRVHRLPTQCLRYDLTSYSFDRRCHTESHAFHIKQIDINGMVHHYYPHMRTEQLLLHVRVVRHLG
jgi:hypothetical protein